MTRRGEDFERHIVEQMLSATRARREAAANTEVEAVDYDWSAPNRLTEDGRARLRDLAGHLAEEINRHLGQLLQAETSLMPGEATEHYGAELAEKESDAYAGQLVAGDRGIGAVVLAGKRGRHWVACLLGNPDEGSGEERKLSSLESALLTDVFAAVAWGLSPLASAAGGEPNVGEEIAHGAVSLDRQDGAAYVRLTFRPVEEQTDEGEGEPEAEDPSAALEVLLSADVVDAAVTAAQVSQPPEQRPPERQAEDALARLHRVRLPVTARLEAPTALRDVMALEPGDVLLTNQSVDEPLAILVGGQAVFRGYPAQSGGAYALQVSEVDKS